MTKFGKIVSGIITYGTVFVIGYWVGGGCEDPKVREVQAKTYNSSIEKKFEKYESRINGLEDRIEKIELEK